MEYIQQYSDTSDDSECADSIPNETQPHDSANKLTGIAKANFCATDLRQSPASTTLTVDYLGLNFSSDDDEVDFGRNKSRTNDTASSSVLSAVDTLLNAYQLAQRELGPENEPLIEPDESFSRPRPRKRRRHVPWSQARQDTKPDVKKEEHQNQSEVLSDVSTRFSLDRELSHIHPSVAQWLDGTPESHLPGTRTRIILTGHRGCINTLDWGGRTWSHLLVSASMDGTVKIWNGLARDAPYTCLWTASAHRGAAVRSAKWSPDGRSVVSGGYDKTARLTYIEKGEEGISWIHPHFVTCVVFHPQTHHLLITGSQGQINCWDIRVCSDKSVKSFRADFNEVQDISFLNGGNELLCCTNSIDRDAADKTIMAWDFRSGAILSNQIFQERYHCTRLRVHPSNMWFVSQTNGNYVAMFSTTRPFKMNKKKRFEGHKVEGYWIGCDLSNDGRYLYSGSSDGALYGYSFQYGSLIKSWPISDQPCLAVECHPVHPSTIAVSGYDGNIYICQ